MNISLIIPAYNEEKYIGACLQSVAKHGGTLFEIIVVDNASTDKTSEIARKFSNVRVVFESQKGLTRARARGLVEARGELVAYIDADTRMPEGWVEKVLSGFAKNKKVVCVSGPYIYFDVPWYTTIGVWVYWNIFAYILYLCTQYMAIGGNFVAKKSALLEIGGFDSSISFYGEDTDIARRLHKVGQVCFMLRLYIYTSGRRFAGEGLVSTAYKYTINFFSIVWNGKPVTKEYNDIR